METKKCYKCGEYKPISEFKVKDQKLGTVYTVCKACHAEYCYDRRLLRKYKMTREQYNDLITAQDHKCAICHVPIGRVGKRFTVDHDHSTGKVRGLLCFNCNTALGYLGDNIDTLNNAIRYLTT